MTTRNDHTRMGVSAALAAYFAWGVMPIYFKLIAAVPPLEIIAHRILWALPVLIVFLVLRDGKKFLSRMQLPKGKIMGLLLSGTILATNWLIFVWAVTKGQVLATSLGYFINPVVNILLGMLFLRERLTQLETAAIVVAAMGTTYLTWFLGIAPWISLGLAFSFGFYGLIRKKLDVGPATGMLWEGLLLCFPAFLYLLWLFIHEKITFGLVSVRLDLLLAFSGLVTILPLTWFNVAAKHMTLATLALFQYIAPTISFLLAVFVYGEEFTHGHKVAFICIWGALLVISIERLVRARKMRVRAS